MGECILAGFGRGSSSSSSEMKFYTEIITANRKWTPPKGMKDNKCYVRIFGGGGSGHIDEHGSILYGGGGGYMNYGEVTINYGEQVHINIGSGGNMGNGGTSYFGNYLSANGGNSFESHNGGNGGSGGISYSWGWNNTTLYGGIGYQFGGGAGFSLGKKMYMDMVVMVEYGVEEDMDMDPKEEEEEPEELMEEEAEVVDGEVHMEVVVEVVRIMVIMVLILVLGLM